MEKQTLTIKIKPDGKIEGTVTGVAGASCTSLIAWLDKLGKVVTEEHTPDYYKGDGQGVSVGH